MLFSKRKAIRSSLLLVAVFTLVLLGASNAWAITRAQVLSRAQSWVDHPVPYSQSKTHLGYRTDCSGYVSMCWATGISWSTSSFHAVTHKIAKSELKPGDAMLKKGYHIRLFHNWTDSSHTSYVAYEANTKVAVARVHSLATDLGAGYVPTRYNGILDGPAPNNAIWNGSFDAWVQESWGADSDSPVCWQVSGADWQTLALHRTDVYHTPASSLQLLNPSDNPDDVTELSQTASVTAGANYWLCAWAKTASDPGKVTLSVEYLDANGQSIATSATSGDAWGIGDAAFQQMSAPTTAPAGAVNACVSVKLAGGQTNGESGTSVILDDVSLSRPQATSSINASAATARIGRSVMLSGSVTPTITAGATAVVYVQRPSKSWKRLAAAGILASSAGTATWRTTYRFKRGMRKGVYRFRATVPAIPGYPGNTTRTVSVRLK